MDDLDAEETALDRRIGERMRARRVALGLTQEQLAKALGVSYQQVQKYEGGSNRITAARLTLVAKRLGVPLGFFFDDAGGPGEPTALFDIADPGVSQRAALGMARGFAAIDDADVRQALTGLVRAVVDRRIAPTADA